MKKALIAATIVAGFVGALDYSGAQTAPVWDYQYTGAAVVENGNQAVVAIMPPHTAVYKTATDCAGDGYQSAWYNAFPFLAAGMQGQVVFACTPVQSSFGVSNATMILNINGPNRPFWQITFPFATQALCQQNIASLQALQNFISNFNWQSTLIPFPTALASTTMTTEAQYSATDQAGGTDNVTLACPPGGP